MEYGNVQRGILGVEGGELNTKASKELGISETQGFYVNRVTKNSGAEKSGLTKGDVIVKLDNNSISTYSELATYINTKRPNDKVNVTYIRGSKTYVVPVTLTKNEFVTTQFKGIELEDIDASDKKKFRISAGVKIREINNDNLKPYYDELIGNIIISVDNIRATDVESVSKIMGNKDENQSVSIEMINKSGQRIRIII